MQNTFSQSGNDSKWFLKKSFFKIGMWHSRTPRDPPPFMANAILNFHFDFLTPSLTFIHRFDNDKVMVIFTNSMELCWPQPMNTPGRVTWEEVFHKWKCSVCHLFHCRNRVSSPPNPGKWCRASAA